MKCLARWPDAVGITGLILLLMLLFFDVVFLGNGLFLRDLTFYHFPMKRVVRDLITGGVFPYWNPYFSAGQPLAANPAYEVFYPFQWLIFLPDYHLGFQLHILLHLAIALIGMYLLLRLLRCGVAAACFGAVSFSLSGIGLSLINILPTLFSFAWVPWVLLFALRFFLRRRARWFALASLVLGMQLLIGEPATVLQTLFLLGALSIYVGRRWRRITVNLLLLVLLVASAAAVGAAQLIPALDFLPDTIRGAGFGKDESAPWSMPLERPAELIHRSFPASGKYAPLASPYYLSIYFGLLGSVLAISGLLLRIRPAGLVATVGAFSYLLAAGSHTPLFDLLFRLGLFKAIRFPERFILFGLFALIVFAALMLQRLLDGDRRLLRVALGCSAVLVVMALPLQWWLTAARCAGLLLLMVWRSIGTHRAWTVAAVIFVAVDLGSSPGDLVPRMPRRFFDAPPLLRSLPSERDRYRIFHEAEWRRDQGEGARYFSAFPSSHWLARNALFPLLPAVWGYRTVLESGTDGTTLAHTRQLVAQVSPVAHRRDDWPQRFGAISNVWVRAEFRPFEREKARARAEESEIRPVLLLRTASNPRYYFADRMVRIRTPQHLAGVMASEDFTPGTAMVLFRPFSPGQGRVLSSSETPNQVVLAVDALGPSFLVFSVSFHKYWRGWIDEREAELHRTNLTYMGMVVPPGRHQVRLVYRNPLVPPSLAISCASVFMLILIASLSPRNRRQP